MIRSYICRPFIDIWWSGWGGVGVANPTSFICTRYLCTRACFVAFIWETVNSQCLPSIGSSILGGSYLRKGVEGEYHIFWKRQPNCFPASPRSRRARSMLARTLVVFTLSNLVRGIRMCAETIMPAPYIVILSTMPLRAAL